VASGRCPHYEDQERKRKEEGPKPLTVERAIALHGERLRRTIKKPEEPIRTMKRRLKPLLGRVIADVTRREWVEIFEEAARETPYAANRLQAYVSSMYSDLCDRGIIETHPLIRLKKRAREIPRDRVFSIDELRRCWGLAVSTRAAQSADQFRHLIGLLALTGCRREEIAAMKWEELDLERRVFNLPAKRSKSGVGRTIPLCDQALAILDRRPVLGRGTYVFGDGTCGQQPFSGFSKAWAVFKKEAGLPDDLRIHDLRRTFSTYADEYIEASIPVIEAFLGHLTGMRGGIVGVYNRANYQPRLIALAERYGLFLDALVRTGTADLARLAFQPSRIAAEPSDGAIP
jgi:integrase